MKTIIIAYDGSECSEAIFTELQHAGLPLQVEAHVVAVEEGWKSLVIDPAVWESVRAGVPVVGSGQAEETEAMRRADALAEQGAAHLRAAFPTWTVATAGAVGSVARLIVRRSQEVSADIIFIGSHSRSTIRRFFLGSVTQKVAAKAKCSVRICRPRPLSRAAPRLLVAVDGSLPSRVAVNAVAERAWPTDAAVAVVNVVEPPLRSLTHLSAEHAVEWRRRHKTRLDWLETVGVATQRQIESAGLHVERHTLDGEPKSTLLEWAERWNADCIFIGESGLQGPDPETLGTVASALAVRAHCSVEIVRPPSRRLS